ncbi:uncharacterized protein [Mytilus edulis]|uniref:uncharacterized protein n=1 Tax=Mytilus edulis TaxID=6550 RepID=UPI0039F03218
MEKFITIFTFLVVFNMLMMIMSYVYIRKSQDRLFCSVSDFLSSAKLFLDHNGARTFKNILPNNCDVESTSLALHIQKLEKAFHSTVNECRRRHTFSRQMEYAEDHPVLTLFTTWEPSPEKSFVHNCTLRNWSSFIPKVNLVLFTNNSNLKKEALQYGWSVLPIIHHVEGVPVLKHMFQTVISTFNSTYYGFSNSDILFVDNLLNSLHTVNREYKDKNVFLTGRRTNIPHLSLKEVVSYDNIRKAASERGELFVVASEDYFITTSRFPWNTIPDFVIGRPAYDNWLVGFARCHFYTVIDITSTVLACHQTTKAGNKEGSKHKTLTSYNHALLVKLGLSTNYGAGFVICPEKKTYYNLCGDIEVMNRPINSFPKYCSCKTW